VDKESNFSFWKLTTLTCPIENSMILRSLLLDLNVANVLLHSI